MQSNLSTFNFNNHRLILFLSILIGISAFIMLNIMLERVMNHIDTNHIIASSINLDKLPKNEKINVLFMGDSRTHQGLSPNFFTGSFKEKNINVHNIGRPGMQAPLFYFLLKNMINNNNKIEHIYIQFSYYLLGGIQWFNDIYKEYYKPSLNELGYAIYRRLLPPHKALYWYLSSRIPVFKFQKKVNSILGITGIEKLLKDFSHSIKTTQNILKKENKGYLSRGVGFITKQQAKSGQIKQCPKNINNGYKVYLDFIKDFFELAANENIKVTVYNFPYPKETQNKYLEECIYFYGNLIKKLAINNPWIEFKDNIFYYDEINFVDPLHLNHIGAKKFSEHIVNFSK